MSLFPLSYLVLSSCNVKSRCRVQPQGGSPYLLMFNLPSLFPFWPSDLLQRSVIGATLVVSLVTAASLHPPGAPVMTSPELNGRGVEMLPGQRRTRHGGGLLWVFV